MSSSKSDEEIFAAALRISALPDRAAFLDQECGGNEEQKKRIAGLLAALDDAGSFLHKPVAEILAMGATAHATQRPDGPSVSVPIDFLAPSDDPNVLGKLGPYIVEEVIGRGGMGIVLRALDPKLNRVVAIKVLVPEYLSNPMAVKRFLREAQAAAAVTHDHVVRIYSVDDETPVPFLVMECIIGQSLQQKIERKGILEIREILRIGTQIASGLAAAHKQGLVHRDVKPANILLENGIERVKITDFGLARAVDDVGMTQSGQVTGTPQYMSPEQALGEQVDHRSDLFSLGSVLYTMCTGRPAFRATSTVAVLRRVVDDTPRPIRELNPETPDWLIEIIDRLMAKKPDQRFQSAAEVSTILERWLAHYQQPQSVPEPTRIALITKPASTAQSSAEQLQRGIFRSAFDEWWSDCDQWIAVRVQFALMTLHVVCMLIFLSMNLTRQSDPGKPTFSYLLGFPSPWFQYDIYENPTRGFTYAFNLWSSSVLFGLIGCALYYFAWRINKARNPRIGFWYRPVVLASVWVIVAWVEIGVGLREGFQTIARNVENPGSASPQYDTVNFNGGWDSIMGPVTLTHRPIVGTEPVEMTGTYNVGAGGGTHVLEGKIDPKTRTFEGWLGNPGRLWGRARFVLSKDGNRITGLYSQDLNDSPKFNWDMQRIVDNSEPLADGFAIQGEWIAVAAKLGGANLPDQTAIRLRFENNNLQVIKPGIPAVSEAFSLNVNESPKRITVTRSEGDNRSAVMNGLYELSRDHLRIAMGEPDEKVNDFKSPPGSNILVADFIRKDAKWPIGFFTADRVLMQCGTIPIDHVGIIDVEFPQRFNQVPTVDFVGEKPLGETKYSVVELKPTGFKILVVEVNIYDLPKLTWRASPDQSVHAGGDRMKDPATQSPDQPALDLSGDWDSTWGTVTFSQEAARPGESAVTVSATYFKGYAHIHGTLDLVSRTFKGHFIEPTEMNGPIQFVVSDDGQSIKGEYAFRGPGESADPTALDLRWEMTRLRKKADTNQTPKRTAPSAAVLEELRKQITQAEQNLETVRALFLAANTTHFEVTTAEHAVLTAKLRLAEREGASQKTIRLMLEESVRLLQDRKEMAKRLVERGQAAPEVMNVAEKDLGEARIRLLEFPSDESEPRKPEAEKENLPEDKGAQRKPFVGKWQVLNEDGGTIFVITLDQSGESTTTNVENVKGKWDVFENDVHIIWTDGWRDIIRSEKTGYVKIAFKPGTDWNETPNDTLSIRKSK